MRGLAPLKHPEIKTQRGAKEDAAGAQEEETSQEETSQEETSQNKDERSSDHKPSLVSVGYRALIHRVEESAHLKGSGVRVNVSPDSPFKSYITTSARLTPPRNAKEERGGRALGVKDSVLREVTFAQPWRPMKTANEVLVELPKRRRPSKLGVYLIDEGRSWWVTQSWRERGLVASSTHIARFAILRDATPPKIGVPRWDLTPHLGPRLIIPISDQLSGISRVRLMWGGERVPIEIQRSWGRFIYRPLNTLKVQTYTYQVILRDRSGNEVKRAGELTWPPPPEQTLPQDLSTRLILTPPER